MPSHSIIVPLDGSKNSEAAVPAAGALARIWSLPVTFVHAASDGSGRTAADREQRDSAFSRYAMGLLSGPGAPKSTVKVLEGNPARAILEQSAGARAIVIASRGRGGIGAALLGSVADKVVRGADIPVLVVPAIEAVKPVEEGPFLVGVDGSTQAEAGLALARELSAAAHAKLILVRSWDILPPPSVEYSYAVPQLSEGLEEEARVYMAKTAKPEEEQIVGRGRADAVIVQAAEASGASIVFMTTQGMGLARRIALGSTTDRVLHSLRRPLFVVPSP